MVKQTVTVIGITNGHNYLQGKNSFEKQLMRYN